MLEMRVRTAHGEDESWWGEIDVDRGVAQGEWKWKEKRGKSGSMMTVMYNRFIECKTVSLQ